jgi:hypothetical protein
LFVCWFYIKKGSWCGVVWCGEGRGGKECIENLGCFVLFFYEIGEERRGERRCEVEVEVTLS